MRFTIHNIINVYLEVVKFDFYWGVCSIVVVRFVGKNRRSRACRAPLSAPRRVARWFLIE